MSDRIYVGEKAESLDYGDKFEPYTGVRLWIDDSQYVFAGNENGRVLEADNPWATQETANDVLRSITGFKYTPFEAENAIVHPAAELGDGVTVGGLYSGIYSQDIEFGHMPTSDISADYDEEIDHEYQFVPRSDRKFDRKIATNEAKTEAALNVLSSNISAIVSQKADANGGDAKSFGWTLTADGFVLSSGGSNVFVCNKDGVSVNGTITSNNATITGGTLTVGDNFSVDSAGNLTANNATITGMLTVGGKQISAADFYTGAFESANNHETWSGTSKTVGESQTNWNNGYNYAYGNTSSYRNLLATGNGIEVYPKGLHLGIYNITTCVSIVDANGKKAMVAGYYYT